MSDFDYCISKYRKLLQLMEDDSEHIALVFKGELLESYRDLVEEEKGAVNSTIYAMRNQF